MTKQEFEKTKWFNGIKCFWNKQEFEIIEVNFQDYSVFLDNEKKVSCEHIELVNNCINEYTKKYLKNKLKEFITK